MNNKPICKIDSESNKYWFLNGKLHREDGPAVECANGTKYWYLNGQRHREDGPAVEYANGSKLWFLNGQKYSYKQWLKLIPNPLKFVWIKFNE